MSTLVSELQRVKEDLKAGRFTNEAAISQGVVLPLLHLLKWPVFNTRVVCPEYSLNGLRVDYALCHPPEHPRVLIEVKKVGASEGADKQLFEYAFHAGAPFVVLTDGAEWSFYLPGEHGNYHERRVYKLDIMERSIDEVAERLSRYLLQSAVSSGNALEAARSDYQNIARKREIERTLATAWRNLLAEPDSLLIDLLAEKVEDLCGYKPDLDTCAAYLSQLLKKNGTEEAPRQPPLPPSGPRRPIRPVQTWGFGLEYKGQQLQLNSARAVMVEALRLFAREDSSFLNRFAARKHGRKRRYVSQHREELYPGRPDLAESHAEELMPGWWVGTNYSRDNIEQILRLACEVAGAHYSSEFKAYLGNAN